MTHGLFINKLYLPRGAIVINHMLVDALIVVYLTINDFFGINKDLT